MELLRFANKLPSTAPQYVRELSDKFETVHGIQRGKRYLAFEQIAFSTGRMKKQIISPLVFFLGISILGKQEYENRKQIIVSIKYNLP